MSGHGKSDGAKLEDSNVAGLGGQENRDAKTQAAQSEAAWKGAGKAVGVEVWRIEQFKVKRWPAKSNGTFFGGDSFIVLRTYHPIKEGKENKEKLAYDLHFWLGKDTTQDEQGTAAYKTVELDDYFKDSPTQYREVQGEESAKFLSLFPVFRVLEGGVATGFKKVSATTYKPRLLHVSSVAETGKTKQQVRVTEVPLARSSLNQGDVFILDAGLSFWIWNGSKANVWEKKEATNVCNLMDDERQGSCKRTFLEGLEDDDTFWGLLGGKGEIADHAPPAPVVERKDEALPKGKTLWKVIVPSDDHKAATFEAAGEPEKVQKETLESNGVYVLHNRTDDENTVWVWLGKDAKDKGKLAMKWGYDFVAAKLPHTKGVAVKKVQDGPSTHFLERFYKLFDPA